MYNEIHQFFSQAVIPPPEITQIILLYGGQLQSGFIVQ